MSATSTKPAEQARSKILRLAFADRMAFNRMVRDGYAGGALIAWLAEHGVPGVTCQNLHKYRHSPAYRNWLAEEAQIQRDQLATEQSMRLAEALGGSASEKLRSILAGTLFRLMPGASPDETAKLVNAVRAVTEAERLDLQRRQVAQRDEQLAFERQKWQRQTVELFKQLHADARASEIADDPALTADQKTDLIGRAMFGEDW